MRSVPPKVIAHWWPHVDDTTNDCTVCGVTFQGPKSTDVCWLCTDQQDRSAWNVNFTPQKRVEPLSKYLTGAEALLKERGDTLDQWLLDLAASIRMKHRNPAADPPFVGLELDDAALLDLAADRLQRLKSLAERATAETEFVQGSRS